MRKKKKSGRKKDQAKRGEKLRIPLPFEQAVKGLMAVKMSPEERKRKD